jgi:hypothetical protein
MRPRRVVALGASNLTRGFQTVVATSREAWGPDVEVIAALGHGRSYGSESRVLARTLPGILQSGLWRQLEELSRVPTRVLLTDVGNDILYGFSPSQILTWVEEAANRLERYSNDIVITGLPHVGLYDISSTKFFFFRSLLYPRCRLTFAEVAESAGVVNEGLAALARARGARFVPLRAEWYGVDPIHIRPSRWQPAWREILCGEPRPGRDRMSFVEGWRLYAMRPEHQRIFGVECGRPQRGVTLTAGGRVWLY